MARFPFNEIELEHECDLDLQCSDLVSNFKSRLTPVSLLDLDHLPKPTLILVPINLEHEPPILEGHIILLGNECELLLFKLDPTFEPYPILEPRLDLNQFHESVLFLEPSTHESKSIVFTNHIPWLNQDVEHYDSKMIFLRLVI